MKKRYYGKLLILLLLLLIQQVMGQNCEPNYSIPYVTLNNVVAPEGMSGNMYCDTLNVKLTAGQQFIQTATNNYYHSAITGFWSFYMKEPRPPIVRASDGDFQDMVLVEWTVEDDRTGPPVTGDEVTLYRNNYVLATLPINQTQYMDFNVFPGEYYQYGVESSNTMGNSHTENNIGFLNPNGAVTGNIATPSGNPVPDTKVMLTPNLGRSAEFGDGDHAYIYFLDAETSLNRLFCGLENSYTIETWFRSNHTDGIQTIFTAVDSATIEHYMKLDLKEGGYLRWQHNSQAGVTGTEIVTVNPYSGDSDWHHVACVFDSLEMTMYVDGFIVGEAIAEGYIDDQVEVIIGKYAPMQSRDNFEGRLDDMRLWSEPREWDDIRRFMDITLSGLENNLEAYWKFDEVEGDVIFDLTPNDNDGTVCHVEHSNHLAPVYVGALTDSIGNYVIQGVYYGNGTTFTATPSKQTNMGRALRFNSEDQNNQYISFDGARIDLTLDYTIEGWFKTPVTQQQVMFCSVKPDTSQSVKVKISMTDDGRVQAQHLDAILTSTASYADNLWHHYAVSFDQSVLTLYVDGDIVDSDPYTEIVPDLSEIVMGRAAPRTAEDYFTGILDEVRVWNLCRNEAQITGAWMQSLEGDEPGLDNYWRMNEGADSLITDSAGSIATGTIQGVVEWTNDIPLLELFDHYYEPESRQVTLNNSNTAVDMVNFLDISLIPISGFIRYESTACFQEGVEILVNGESLVPPNYTDADGKWIIELEPGSTGDIIVPNYNDHNFIPPLIELPLISSPRTGLYFSDQELRTLSGIVAGGNDHCTITPRDGNIEVTIRAVNGCLESSVRPNLNNGEFTFEDLPPLMYQIFIDHPNSDIDGFFNADTLSLEDADGVYDFIYYSTPEVTITGDGISDTLTLYLEDGPPLNGVSVMQMSESYPLTINIDEPYTYWNGEESITQYTHSDSGSVHIIDGIGNDIDSTYFFTNGSFEYIVLPGEPRFITTGDHPYQKSIEVHATDNHGNIASCTEWVVVTGTKPRIPEYTITTPQIPLLILRDPPGNNSYSSFSTTDTHETSISISKRSSESTSEWIKTNMGINITTEQGLLFSTQTNYDVTMEYTNTASWSTSNVSQTEQSWSFSTSNVISTSNEPAFVGEGADLYMGGAVVLIVGKSDDLFISNDYLLTDVSTIMAPDSITTIYLETEDNIENVIIPALQADDDTISVARWLNIIEQNHQLKENAAYIDILTFSGGASYEYSQTNEISTTISSEFETELDYEFAEAAGLEIDGIGDTGGAIVSWKFTTGGSESTTTTHSTTVGYTLNDADDGDEFVVDLKWDTVYGTPVFDTQSGQSCNPWEENTIPRDAPVLSISPSVMEDVLPDEEAVFTISCENANQLNEDRTYLFMVNNESNEDGAKISLNGNPLILPMAYTIPHEGVAQGILTIGRNTNIHVYEYDNLKFVLYGENDPAMVDTATVSVNFQQPASEINIYVPENEWLVNSSDGDTLEVRLNGYDLEAENLASIELQYRPSTSTREDDKVRNKPLLSSSVKTESESSIFSESKTHKNIKENEERDGDWFSLAIIPKDSLFANYKIIYWDISPTYIVNGAYQLRGVTNPTSGDAHGYSYIVEGIIDRNGPAILGNPEPVDGILGADDNIAIHFNEEINGELISQANQDIKLKYSPGENIDFDFTYGDNTITVEPAVNNEWIENQTLCVVIDRLQDMHGNSIAEQIRWEFFVNRNPIEWVGQNINEVIYFNETVQTSRVLRNAGGGNRNFELIGGRDNALPSGNPLPLPSWLEISPIASTLTPGEEISISINLIDDISAGTYSTTIYANAIMGDEPLIIDIRILDYPPEWSVDMTDFEFSMNMTAELFVDGIASEDIYDLIGVFFDEECLGVGEISYLPEFTGHNYESFITIYSNETPELPDYDPIHIDFKVWDASESTILGNIVENYVFVADSIYGNPAAPAPITTTSQIIQNIPIHSGWNWLSFNLCSDNPEDMEINNFLESLSVTDGDYIKTQTSFSTYVELDSTFGIWTGSITEIDNSNAYFLKSANDDVLELTGDAVNVELDTLFIVKGWNWISYLPQYGMELEYALSSLDSLTSGDLIKSQCGFAQYIENMGWYGNMAFMSPNTGYKLKKLYKDKLVYPFEIVPLAMMPETYELSLFSENDLRGLPENAPDWLVIPEQYQYSMNLIGTIWQDELEAGSEMDYIAAFCEDECIGAGQPVYVEDFDRHILFMTIYSDTDDCPVTLRYFDGTNSEIREIDELIEFSPDGILGSVVEPYEMHTSTCTEEDIDEIPAMETRLQSVYPNPFNPELHIRYSIKKETRVEIDIYNIRGQKVSSLLNEVQTQGYYDLTWNAHDQKGNTVSSGVYFLKIKAADYKEMRKVLLMK